jgi:hypothetical protein
MPYRTATLQDGEPAYVFGHWTTYEGACLEMLRIAREWEEEWGLQVVPFGEQFPEQADVAGLVGKLRGKRRWTFSTQVVPDD